MVLKTQIGGSYKTNLWSYINDGLIVQLSIQLKEKVTLYGAGILYDFKTRFGAKASKSL